VARECTAAANIDGREHQQRGDEIVSLYQEACKYIPGGVNSPVRAFRGVGGEPIFFARARGSRVWAADGREFIDYVGSWAR